MELPFPLHRHSLFDPAMLNSSTISEMPKIRTFCVATLIWWPSLWSNKAIWNMCNRTSHLEEERAVEKEGGRKSEQAQGKLIKGRKLAFSSMMQPKQNITSMVAMSGLTYNNENKTM